MARPFASRIVEPPASAATGRLGDSGRETGQAAYRRSEEDGRRPGYEVEEAEEQGDEGVGAQEERDAEASEVKAAPLSRTQSNGARSEPQLITRAGSGRDSSNPDVLSPPR